MSAPDANGWLPIEECPVTDRYNDDEGPTPLLMVWVANGWQGKGCPAFGVKSESGKVRAQGFSGGWQITHFQFVKPPVSP